MTQNTMTQPSIPDIQTIKAWQKVTWESGDFGQVAKFIMADAEAFMARIDLQPGMKVLDAACGTGNLAVLAARRGCVTSGLDIASNLIAQARERAQKELLAIEFTEGDAEAMPYPDASFDAVVSMYGVMFAPRPERVVSELRRVVKPGGLIALANWAPAGFIGKRFAVFARHLPPPAGFPSPLLWGDEAVVRARFAGAGQDLRLIRRTARMWFPFNPTGTVDFFRRYYGPTLRAFASLEAAGQAALSRDLVELQTRHNVATRPNETETPAEYLEIQARRIAAN
jgi:ubiquinone/menaquinone biosynthesis C-methylase UbiE